MREQKATAGDVIEIELLEADPKRAQLATLIKTANLEALQISVPAGGTVPTHRFPGEAIIHCLQGRVVLQSQGDCYDLHAGQLLFYCSDAPFSVRGIEDSSLLITVALPGTGAITELIG
jgi:quercetin dioxygenase-like cupin family protein